MEGLKDGKMRGGNEECRECPRARRCINGLFCTEKRQYVEHMTVAPCGGKSKETRVNYQQ